MRFAYPPEFPSEFRRNSSNEKCTFGTIFHLMPTRSYFIIEI
jgi:hypothetical protein